VAKCVVDPIVEEELWEIWDYIAKDNPEAATEVRKAAQETFHSLAKNPRLGKPRTLRIQRIYVRPVAGFERYLVYYRKISGGIQVIHILHDGQNLKRIFRNR